MRKIKARFLSRIFSGKKISNGPSIAVADAIICAWLIFVFGLSAIAGVQSAWSYGVAPVAFIFIATALIISAQITPRTVIFDQQQWSKYSSIFFISLITIKLLWIIFFDSAQVSDFGIYFHCGISQAKSLQISINECQSSFLEPNSTYWLRSFFYSFPISVIFGDDYAGFKLSNLLIHIVTIVIWYVGINRFYGPRVALVSSILLALYPEYWFTITLVSTDNLVILFVVLFILILPEIDKPGRTGITSAIILGFIIFLSQQLRSIGLILIISALAWALIRRENNFRISILNFLILLTSYYCISNLFSLFFSTGLPDIFNTVKILSTIDFNSTQDFSVNYRWAEHYWPALPKDMSFDISTHKIFVELSQFSEWPAYFFKKTAINFSGTGYYGLSSFNFPPGNPDSSLNIEKSTIPFFSSAFQWLGAFVTLLLVASMKSIVRLPKLGPVFSSTILIAIFSLVVLGMGEAQARYSLLLAPALALLVAIAFFPQDSTELHDSNLGIKFLSTRLLCGVLCISAAYFFVVLAMATIHPEGDISKNARLTTLDDNDFTSCKNNGITLENNYKDVKVSFDSGSDCAAFYIKIPKTGENISFFVSGAKFPYRFEEKYHSGFEYGISSGNSLNSMKSLGDKSVVWHKIPIRTNDNNKIYFRITRKISESKDYLSFSLFNVD